MILIILCASPTSTRAYIPCVQPPLTPSPRVTTKLVPIKEIKGYGTGYFGPIREEYATRRAYHKAITMNGEGKETKSGTRPKIGTIAADTRFYPLGTIIFIPEINLLATVEDIGSKIKGKKHVDIFCGHGKNAERIANTWGPGTPITLVIMKKI